MNTWSSPLNRPKLVIEYTIPQGRAPSNNISLANLPASILQYAKKVLFAPVYQADPTPTPTVLPNREVEEDEFDGPELAPGWEWYVPKAGPTYSLSAVPGAFRMTLPAGDAFEHWEETDEAPQLRRTGLGDADWAIEARLEDIDAATDAAYWAAMEVGFSQYDQIWFGMGDTGELGVIRVNDCCVLFPTPEDKPVTLRLEKHGEDYTFLYKSDSDPDWTVAGKQNYPGTPTYVGLLGRGFNTGSTQLHMDWSYFRLERWPSAPSTATPTYTPTSTPTATWTPSNTPTPTDTPTITPSPTDTPTRTPTASQTPTNTATNTGTPTNTRTPTNTFTPIPTRTPRPVGSSTPVWTQQPASTSTPLPLPTGTPFTIQTALPGSEETTIYYTYDSLYRLTAADYASTSSTQRSTGEYYHYIYGEVGNRLTQESTVSGLPSTVNYTYDIANRLS